jgi:hypothetical protein
MGLKIYRKSQCCGSEMFIPDLGPRIQKQQQKRGVKNNFLSYHFSCYEFHKIDNYFIFEMLKKIFLANFQRILEVFTPKIVHELST